MSNFIVLITSVVGFWAIFKYFIIYEVRIDANTFKTLYDLSHDENVIILGEEFITENRYPVYYSAIYKPEDATYFFIHHTERIMHAGWHSKDHVTTIFCVRWRYKKIKEYLRFQLKDRQFQLHGIPVQLMLPGYTDKIGSLKEMAPEPLVDKNLWVDFENEVQEVVLGQRKKTSALLYGPPGNGKTSFVKYLTTKYQLPIMIFTLNPDWNNHDLLLLFSQIPKKCIVLFEDFDNYFDNRTCIFNGADKSTVKFTFDVLLNGLDGVYNTYEGVVFIMTVNDIEKVDKALKNRPTRFKFVKHFDNPKENIRKVLLPEDYVIQSEGMNLDQIIRLKEYLDQGLDMSEAISMLYN